MLWVLLASSLALSQTPSIDDTPNERVVRVELVGGASSPIEHTVTFDGTLHVWGHIRGDLRAKLAAGGPTLRVAGERGRELGRDDSGGSRSTPYVRLDVRKGEQLLVHVALTEPSAEALTVELHLVAAPESEGTLEAASRCLAKLDELKANVKPEAARAPAARAHAAALLAELATVENGATSDRIADALRRVGDAAADLGDLVTWRAAREHLIASWSRTLPPTHDLLCHARLDLAVVLSEQGEQAAARGIQESVLAGIGGERAEHDALILRARNGLALVLKSQGELARAALMQERVLAAYEGTRGPGDPHILSARENLAMTLKESGDLSRARELLELVIEERERVHAEHDRRTTLSRLNLAVVLYQLGQLSNARAIQEVAVTELARELPEDHPDLLRAQTSLAVTLEGMEDNARARELLEHVLAIRRRTLDEGHPDLCIVLMNLAALHKLHGDYPGALALEEQVVASLERARPADHPELLAAIENLAITVEELGDVDRSRILEERVLIARESTLPNNDLALNRTRLNLGGTYYRLGEIEQSRDMFELAVAALQGVVPDYNAELLGARTNLALVAKASGDLKRAAELEESVLEVRLSVLPEHHPDVLRLRHNLAITKMWAGEEESARVQGRALAEGMVRRTLAALLMAPREVGEMLARDGRKVGQVLALAESADEHLCKLAFELVETRRVASSEGVRSAVLDGSDPELTELVAGALRTRAALNELAAAPRTSTQEAEIRRLSLARDEAERGIRTRLAKSGVPAQRVRLEDIAAFLPPNAAAVGYLRYERWSPDPRSGYVQPGPDSLLAHVVRNDGVLVRVELGRAQELEASVSAWREALGRTAGRGVGVAGDDASAGSEVDSGAALRAMLLDPVLEACGPNVDTLYVCAADLVHLVPLDALPESGTRVGDRVQVVLTPSFGRLMAPAGAVLREPSLLALGDVDYGTGPGFSALPETGPEAREVAARFRQRFALEPVVLERDAATKAALAAHAPTARYLHLATHGWFAGEKGMEAAGRSGDRAPPAASEFAPMLLCGLALAGANSPGAAAGALTAEELVGYDLSGCELAVLSACETNVGFARAGLGIQSLQTALQTAGARTAITSLWKVDDAATRALFDEFYSRIWGGEESKAEALWNAKAALRALGMPPRDWGAWVLTGDPH